MLRVVTPQPVEAVAKANASAGAVADEGAEAAEPEARLPLPRGREAEPELLGLSFGKKSGYRNSDQARRTRAGFRLFKQEPGRNAHQSFLLRCMTIDRLASSNGLEVGIAKLERDRPSRPAHLSQIKRHFLG